MKRNPKLKGSVLFDCIPQEGKCPQGCNQCFFNRCFYTETPLIPNRQEISLACVEEGIKIPIVRMNTGHDSNINRDLVIKVSKGYPEVFFNTSIPRFDFPGPVVWTANPKEEQSATLLESIPENLMFIRLRVSSTNLELIREAVLHYNVPIVLTFMAYYDGPPEEIIGCNETANYEYKVRHTNNYWCPKDTFIKRVMSRFRDTHLCGKWCKDCRNCETFYWRSNNE